MKIAISSSKNKINFHRALVQIRDIPTFLFKKVITIMVFVMMGCEPFVEVELPLSQIVGETVFQDSATATSALADIYAQLRDEILVSGTKTGMSNLLGLYSDELRYYGIGFQLPQTLFQEHNILPTDDTVGNWWYGAYNLIYAANAVVEGVSGSQIMDSEERDQIMGEGLFIRAYLHMYLTELFGDIPYVKVTDYRINGTAHRMPKELVYENIIEDLNKAKELLNEDYVTPERTRPNKFVAQSLIARAYLYMEQWKEASLAAGSVISSTGTYQWEEDLEKVFLLDSPSTIFQLKLASGASTTWEAITFYFETGPPPGSAISPEFLNFFEPADLRKNNWIRKVENDGESWGHVFKYKQIDATGSPTEYSKLFRLAELYLIRAEGNARLGNLEAARGDLNKVRRRAGLPDTQARTELELVDAILLERRAEFFTEYGHRWFDLKRTGKAARVLSPLKPGWQDTDVLFPIPESELLVNPNLDPQNNGY